MYTNVYQSRFNPLNGPGNFVDEGMGGSMLNLQFGHKIFSGLLLLMATAGCNA
jgi:hypothetical protein